MRAGIFFTPYLWIAFAAASSAVGSCGYTPVPTDDDQDVAPLPINESTTSVTATPAQTKPFEYFIRSNGKVKSLRDQVITGESEGNILQLNTRPGNNVSAGSPIIHLESTSIQHRLQKAKLAQFNGQKEYESQLLGYENLLKGKSQEQADEIRQKLRISTGLSGAEQDIEEANYELKKAVIKAPFTGLIADLKVSPGEYLKKGQEICRIYDPGNLVLEIKVLEADIGLIKKGTPADISPISNPQLKYRATVYEINPYVDEHGMVSVKLSIRPADLKAAHSQSALFPGMNCTAAVKVAFAKALLVPKEAVVMRSGRPVVFTLDNGKAKWNDVTVGRDNGIEIEIKEGIREGEKVITTNNLQLAHDAPVKESGVTEKR